MKNAVNKDDGRSRHEVWRERRLPVSREVNIQLGKPLALSALKEMGREKRRNLCRLGTRC